MSVRDLVRRLKRLEPPPTPGPLTIILVGEYDENETEEEAWYRVQREGKDVSGHVVWIVEDRDP